MLPQGKLPPSREPLNYKNRGNYSNMSKVLFKDHVLCTNEMRDRIVNKPLPSVQRSMRERGRNILSARGMGDPKRTVSSGHSRNDTHMSSQRLWKHTKGLHGLKLGRVKVLGNESGHKLTFLTEKLSPIGICFAREMRFLLWSLTGNGNGTQG